MKTILTVRGTRVNLLDDGSVEFLAGLTVDADGSPHAYGPNGLGLDYLANAGHPGNWWGIVTDKNGKPIIQGPADPAPGYYISTTSYHHPHQSAERTQRYLNSEVEKFIVVPTILAKCVKPIVLGCLATVTNTKTGEHCTGIVGDFGPATHLGEASIAVANALGVDSDPKRGGTDSAIFLYRFYPGVEVPGYFLHGLA